MCAARMVPALLPCRAGLKYYPPDQLLVLPSESLFDDSVRVPAMAAFASFLGLLLLVRRPGRALVVLSFVFVRIGVGLPQGRLAVSVQTLWRRRWGWHRQPVFVSVDPLLRKLELASEVVAGSLF